VSTLTRDPGAAPDKTLATAMELARQLRIDVVRATAASNAGHPTSGASAAELRPLRPTRATPLPVRRPRS